VHVKRIATGVLAALFVIATPGLAQGSPVPTTVASGLDSPRGIAFGVDGALYVAEAGRGGAGPCFPGPEGEACYGESGAISRITYGGTRRVVTGLPSIAAPNGRNAIGPSDVSAHGTLHFTVGLGANPELRATLPPLGQQALGWLLWDKRHGFKQVADVAGFEATANPDGGEPDSNPQSLLGTHHGFLVADAGGNSLVRVAPNGQVETVAVFPDQLVDAPPMLGLPPGTQVPSQAVPTSVVRGPDGAYYVGTLTGFPFAPGSARVFRVVPGEEPTVYAGGFTNVIDIAFGQDGTLYVLEIAHDGLLSGDETGALIRVGRDGEQEIVASEGLTAPGGLAIRGRSAYVSNCGTCAGVGTVLRIPL
jgi:hypothetical protein